MWKIIILSLAMLSLLGCGAAAIQRARSDMEESKAAYKACLEQHPSDVSACEALEKGYEADLKALDAVKIRTNTIVVTE